MAPFIWLFDLLLNTAISVIVVQAIMSWLISFNILNLQQRLVRLLWEALNRLTEPVYRPVRRFMPNLGGLDITPMVIIVALLFLQRMAYAYLFLPS